MVWLMMAVLWASLPANAQFSQFNDALVDAADQGARSTVTQLLRSSYPADSRGKFGVTALMRASYHGHKDIAELLLNVGANTNAVDIGGATALHLASRQGHVELVRLLVQYGAYPELADNEGWTPLMRAVSGEHRAVSMLLLEKGADVNAVNRARDTPLMIAVQKGNAALAEVLIKAGANANHINARGISVLQAAQRRNDSRLTSLIAGHAKGGPASMAAKAPVKKPLSAYENFSMDVRDKNLPASLRSKAEQQAGTIAEARPPVRSGVPVPQSMSEQVRSIVARAEGKAPALATLDEAEITDLQDMPWRAGDDEPVEVAVNDDKKESALEKLFARDVAAPRSEAENAFANEDALETGLDLTQAGSAVPVPVSRPVFMASLPWREAPREPIDLAQTLQQSGFPGGPPASMQRSTAPVAAPAPVAEESIAQEEEEPTEIVELEAEDAAEPEVEIAAAEPEPEPEPVVIAPPRPVQGTPWATPNKLMEPGARQNNLTKIIAAPEPAAPAAEDAPLIMQASKAPPAPAPVPSSQPVLVTTQKELDSKMRQIAVLPDIEVIEAQPEVQQAKQEIAASSAQPSVSPQKTVTQNAPEMVRPARIVPPSVTDTDAGYDEVKPVDVTAPVPPAGMRADMDIDEEFEEIEPATAPKSMAKTAAPATISKPAPQQETEEEIDEELLYANANTPAKPAPQLSQAPVTPAPAAPVTEVRNAAIVPPNEVDSALSPGEVEVSEAVRVPLSTRRDVAVKAAPVATATLPTRGSGSFYPSEMANDKRYWIDIKDFATEEDAIRFFDAMAAQEELFLRMRVMRPATARPGLVQPITLRVGTFESAQNASDTCLLFQQQGKRCGLVQEQGESAPVRTAQGHRLGFERGGYRSNSAFVNNSGADYYWVQLGTYTNEFDAIGRWQQLRTQHQDVLASLKVNIFAPKRSSAGNPSLRLRAGPFNAKSDANATCRALKERSVSCIAVMGK